MSKNKSIIFEKSFTSFKIEVWRQKPTFPVTQVHQVHSAEIVSAQNKNLSTIKADGIQILFNNDSFKEKNPLCIVTADCLPIIIIGQHGAVALHAGWKGLAQDILSHRSIKQISPTEAFIAPSIHPCCYEVGEDFTNNFPQSDSFLERAGKIYFDLQKEASNRLKRNFAQITTYNSNICTCCSSDFHSYRRNKTEKRNWNLFFLSE